jgi:hypothetical protein
LGDQQHRQTPERHDPGNEREDIQRTEGPQGVKDTLRLASTVGELRREAEEVVGGVESQREETRQAQRKGE